MIQANELRIGNLVSFEGMAETIASIHSDNTVRLRDKVGKEHGCFYTSLIKPVPLTEEWLLKMGFLKIKNKGLQKDEYPYAYTKTLHFWLAQRDYIDRFCVYYKNTSTNYVYIGYLHQLQNLYFALTGEELTIKP